MKRKFIAIIMCLVLCVSLAGCQSEESAAVLNELNSLQGLNTGFAEGQSLSFSERQALLYKKLRDHQLLKISGLNSCSQEEINACMEFLSTVDMQLCGQLRGDDTKVTDDMIDYMLLCFETTPYYWQRSSVTIQGKDIAADYIIADVTYRTIDFPKDVLRDSSIVMGAPNYDNMMKIRMERAIAIYEMKYQNRNDTAHEGQAWLTIDELTRQFEDAYGTFEEVYEEQNNYTPSEYIYLNGNQKTTSGVSENTQTTGTMTFRFVLNPKLVYGINMGMECQHLYLYSFNLNEDVGAETENILDKAGYNTLADAVYKLVKSYFTCVDEANYEGLYKLMNSFGKYDKYYQDWFEHSYRNHDNFRVEITSIVGTTIRGKVTIASGERPLNTKMTLPSYTDTFTFEINLYDENLQFTDIHLVSRVLDGEPVIEVKLGEETGFSYEVALSDKDKTAIENIITQLAVVQLTGNTYADEFVNLVDLTITEADMAALRNNVFSISGDHKAVWIQSYIQGTSNYALVQCKEQVHNEEGITEYTTRYEFILKRDIWALSSYNVVSSVKLSLSNLSTSDAMCVVTPTGVESYSTKVLDSDVEETDEPTHEVYTQEFKEYKPSIVKHDSLSADAEIIVVDLSNEDPSNPVDTTIDTTIDTENPDNVPTYEIPTFVLDTSTSTPEEFLEAFCSGYFENYLIMMTSAYADENFKNYVNELQGATWIDKFYDADSITVLAQEKDITKTWVNFKKLVNNYWNEAFTETIDFDKCAEYSASFDDYYLKLLENDIDLHEYIIFNKEIESEEVANDESNRG